MSASLPGPCSALLRWLLSARPTCSAGWLGPLALGASLVLAAPHLGAQDPPAEPPVPESTVPTPEELWKLVQKLSGEVAGLRATVNDLNAQLDAARATAVDDDQEGFYIPRLSADFQESGLPQQFGNIYTKPYLATLGQRTYLGGYIDFEYVDPSGGDKDRFFDQHRFVPFFYSDVSDRVKIAAELEFEHGHEVKVEFAQIDYLFNDAFNFRAGIMLLPLGKLNEVHDTPVQDLTIRPLVNRFIIPTTLRDAGVGAFGDISEDLSYQVAVTNGFRGLDDSGAVAINNMTGLRSAAPQSDTLDSPFTNSNDKLAYSGRVAWTPLLGTEFGVSALHDTYDEAGDNDLRIMALDATVDGKALAWLPDPLELLGEFARADIERDAFAKASGVAGDMDGYYAQANWHFGDSFLESWKQSGLVEDGAHFTFVTRYDHVDLDDYSMRRTTVGLNFRPNSHNTVFKLDYQFNDDSGANNGTNADNAVLFSVATYF